MKRLFPVVACLCLCHCLCLYAVADDAAPRGGGMRVYETPYYTIHTDLEPHVAAEAVLRARVMGQEYRQRTRELGFTGRITRRLPFYIYRRREDYLATGAPPESAGSFQGERLVAVATHRSGAPAWHVVQHEAFHQFAAAVEGTELPAWVNEGLAEYFGEALFTGGEYVTGIVPPWRLARVKRQMKQEAFEPLADLLDLTQDEWNRGLRKVRYDHAWTLVHFVLHADDADDADDADRRRGAFVKFIGALAAGRAPMDAWAQHFGDTGAFERAWRKYWLDLPDNASAGSYARAAVSIYTHFLARAAAAGHRFDGAADFLSADPSVLTPPGQSPEDWLPPTLLEDAKAFLPGDAVLRLDEAGGTQSVVVEMPRGPRVRGRFELKDGKVGRVEVVATDFP